MIDKLKLKKNLRVLFGRGILSVICSIYVLIFIVIAIFAPLLARYSPTEFCGAKFLSPCAEFLFGTDALGRDVFSRIMYGARISFIASLLSSAIGLVMGTTLGLIAGYFKGFISMVIMRFTDAILSIPALILSMVLALLFKEGGILSVGFVIGFTLMSSYTRVIYGLVLGMKENDYIVAAKLVGQSKLAIIFKHFLPNCFPSLIVMFTMTLGNAISLESSLSFLGVGITPPTPAWGSMVSEGYKYLVMKPSLAILPGIFVLLTVVAFNVIGDGVRDVLDPRLKGKL